MKNYIIIILLLSFGLMSCSSDETEDETQPAEKEYAMTAKINGEVFQANTPLGDNVHSNTNIWNYFPIEDYVMLQGRKGGVLGNTEIKIWLKRSDIVVGTYEIGQETFSTPPSHFIDLLDNSNEIYENTKEGVIEILNVNSSTKIVTGSFHFTCVDDLNDPSAAVVFTVTEGTFKYKYED